MRGNHVIVVFAIVMLASLVVSPTTVGQGAPVHVGELGAISDAPVYIAFEKGYFRDEGINARFVRFDSGARMIPFLATGQLDAGVGAISAGLFNAIAEGIELRIVADKGSHTPGHGYTHLVVRKDLLDSGAIRTLADLKGKSVALSAPDAINAVQLDLMLGTVGLSLSDVKIVRIAFADMNAAFANRAVDAAMQAEPLASVGVSQNLYVIFKRIDELLPNFNGGVMFFGPSLWKTRPGTATKFMVAYLRAVRDYYDAIQSGKDKSLIISILAKHTAVKDTALYEKMYLPGINPNGYVDKKSIGQAQDWWAAKGLVKSKVDVEKIIDYRWLEAAIKRLGRR